MCSPTGSGKSYVFMAMAEKCKGNVLVLIHRGELKDQVIADFQKNNIPMDNITVETVQTVYRHLDKYPPMSLVIVDEAHNYLARTFKAAIDHFAAQEAFVVGFSASPLRTNGAPLSDVFQVMEQSVSVKWLIENKRLCPYTYYAPLAVDVSNLKKQRGDYVIGEVEEIMDSAIYGNAIAEFQKICPKAQAIAFCVSISHSQQVAQQFRDAGIKAEHLDGNTPKKERKAIMERFRAGEIQVLTNCSLISEGLSIDGVEAVIMLRPSCSTSLVIQQWGRALRYAPGKTAVILDCVGNYSRFGLPDDHREWSLDGSQKTHKEMTEEGLLTLRQCSACFKVYRPAPSCPFCGEPYELKPREIKAMEDIELKRIEAEQLEAERARKAQAAADIKKARSYEELLAIAKRNGYKNPQYWARLRSNLRGYK